MRDPSRRESDARAKPSARCTKTSLAFLSGSSFGSSLRVGAARHLFAVFSVLCIFAFHPRAAHASTRTGKQSAASRPHEHTDGQAIRREPPMRAHGRASNPHLLTTVRAGELAARAGEPAARTGQVTAFSLSGVGGETPTFLNGFRATRGRPDPQNRRSPVCKNHILKNQVCRLLA